MAYMYASRSLTATERRYAQIGKECLAIVFACDRFDQYIHGRECIKVRTDHKPLESIFQKSLLTAPRRLQRMLLRLQKYSPCVSYKKGKEMYLADTLSRAGLPHTKMHPTTHSDQIFNICGESGFEEELEYFNQTDFLNVTHTRLGQIQQHTAQDTVLQVLKSNILTGWPETKEEVPVIIREYWTYRDELSAQIGVLFKGPRIIIPKSMRPEMLGRIHSSHLGAESFLRKARDVLYWPNMSSEIRYMVGLGCQVLCLGLGQMVLWVPWRRHWEDGGSLRVWR